MKEENFEPMAYKAISNMGGIEIMLSNSGDAVIYRRHGKIARGWQEVKYTNSGRAYFTVNKTRQYLDEYVKISIK